MKQKIEISCCLCSEKFKTEVEMPDGWKTVYDETYEEKGFCPKHRVIEKFTENCSGCVGGWIDCNLWRSFAYSKMELTEEDFRIIQEGRCPKRTNGTMIFSREEGIREINIGSPGSSESGKALAKAIKEYSDKYHKSNDSN